MTSSFHKIVVIVAFIFSTGYSPAQDQTLADVARKAKEQQSQDSGKAIKVYTNEDVAPARNDLPKTSTASVPSEVSKKPSGPTAAQWKAAILRQKSIVDNQQKKIDRLQASIHYVDGSQYSEAPAYNATQNKKQARVEVMKSKLAEEKQKLDDLMEKARKAGFGNSVYDQ